MNGKLFIILCWMLITMITFYRIEFLYLCQFMVVTQFKFLHCHVKDKYQFIKKSNQTKGHWMFTSVLLQCWQRNCIIRRALNCVNMYIKTIWPCHVCREFISGFRDLKLWALKISHISREQKKYYLWSIRSSLYYCDWKYCTIFLYCLITSICSHLHDLLLSNNR